MAILKKIKPFKFAKFQALLMALLGILAGVFYSFGGLIIDSLVEIGWIESSSTPGLSFGTALAFGALLGMPVIFAISGFLMGLLEAFLFNLFSKWFGGARVDFW